MYSHAVGYVHLRLQIMQEPQFGRPVEHAEHIHPEKQL